MDPGFNAKVEKVARKWGVPTDGLTSLYEDFVLSRMQQPSWPESIVEQCTSLQKALGLKAITVGKTHYQVAVAVYALVEAEQLPADSVGRFLFLSDRIQDAQAGAFLEEARRYERTQLAKAFFISEQEVRAKIARVAMPMYQKVVERFIAGESIDLASERRRLGVDDDCLLEVQLELTPKMMKTSEREFEIGLKAALSGHDLRDVNVFGLDSSILEDRASSILGTEEETGGGSVKFKCFVEAKQGSRDVVERAINGLSTSKEALERFRIALMKEISAEAKEMEIQSASVEVEGWQTVHLAAFEANATEANIDALSAAMDMNEEDRIAVGFGGEARAAIADGVMDGPQLAETATRMGVPAETAASLAKSIAGEAFAEWCAELPDRAGGPDEGAAFSVFVQRVVSAGRILKAVGAPVRGAFDAKERVVGICSRILKVAEEGTFKPEDLEVVKWIATSEEEFSLAYKECDQIVREKVKAVLENLKEASDLDTYIRNVNYPADLLADVALREYSLMLEQQLKIAPSAMPTEEESRELAEKAKALRLDEKGVQTVHEGYFAPLYSEACKETVSSESVESLSKLDGLRVQLVFSEGRAKKLMEGAIADELKPAADEILEGCQVAMGKAKEAGKIGFAGGVTGAVDKILNLSKVFDFTLVSTGLVNLNGTQPLYKYIMTQDMNKAAEFASVLGISDEMKDQVHTELGGQVLGKTVVDALNDDKPISAELTTGLWEPLGLPQEWAEKFIAGKKSNFISGKFDNLFFKGLKADEIVQARSLAEEWGIKLNELDSLPLPKRKRLFHIEAVDALANNIELGSLEEVADTYGLSPDQANSEVEAAMKQKEKNDRFSKMAKITR
jgi:hypothetical protein